MQNAWCMPVKVLRVKILNMEIRKGKNNVKTK
jgi:hypothetical protein